MQNTENENTENNTENNTELINLQVIFEEIQNTEIPETQEPAPKRKSISFKYYITKILNQHYSPYYYIITNTKSILHTMIMYILRKITKMCVKLYGTINVLNIEKSVKLILTGDLLQAVLNEGNYARKLKNKEFKDNYNIPNKLLKDYFLQYYPNKKIGIHTDKYLTGIMEYLIYDLLDLITKQSKKNHGYRISNRDIYLGVYQDSDYLHLFSNFSFPNGYSNRLLDIKEIKELVIENEEPTEEPTEEHKNEYQIYREQWKTSQFEYCISKTAFINLTKEVYRDICEDEKIEQDIRFNKDTFTLLHSYIEQSTMDLLIKAKKLSQHSNRTRISNNDILLAMELSL